MGHRRQKIQFVTRLLVGFLTTIGFLGCSVPGNSTSPSRIEVIPEAVQLDDIGGSIFGLEENRASYQATLASLELLGARWVRRNGIQWSQIEPVQGQRNWDAVAAVDRWLESLSSAGYEAVLIVRSTPAWAQQFPGVSCGPIREDKIDAFGSFMRDLVTRYRAPPFNVRYWEIWNEPDASTENADPAGVYGCWGNPEATDYGGSYYAEVLKTVYPLIKEADPNARVLIGGLLLDCDPDHPPEEPPGSGETKDCSSGRFFEGILQSGAANSFDGISYHAYDYYYGEQGKFGNPNWASAWNTTGPSLSAKAIFLRDILADYDVSSKFMMNTESGLLCSIPGEEAICSSAEFQATKADYLVKTFVQGMEEKLSANIWFSLSGWRNSGLVNADHGILPAFETYQFASEAIGETEFVRRVNLAEGVETRWFLGDGRTVWVLWAREGTVPVSLPGGIHAMYSSSGQPLEITTAPTLTPSPIYVYWE